MNDYIMDYLLPPADTIIVDKNKDPNIKIEELIIHAVYDSIKFADITRKFFELYKTRYNYNTKETSQAFERFLNETICSNATLLESKLGVKKLRKNHAGLARDLKKRWVLSAKKSLEKKSFTLLKKELKEIKQKYIATGDLPLEGMQAPEDIINIRINQFEEWSSSVLNLIIDYPYLMELTDSKILSALKHDMILCITEVLQNEYDYDITKILSTTPGVIAPGMFAPQKRGKRVNHMDLTKEGNLYTTKTPYTAKTMAGTQLDFGYDFYPQKANTELIEQLGELFFELDEDTTGTKATTRLYLDRLDLNIIRLVYGYSPAGSARFKIFNLLTDLGLPPNGKNYQKIEEKLLKLPYYAFYFGKQDSNHEYDRTSFNLFSQIRVFVDNNGDKVVDIYYSRLPALEKATTAIMYKNELKKMKLPHSADLTYFLEGQRRMQLERGADLQHKKYRYDFEQLQMHINYGKRKTVKEITDFLTEACIEITTNQFIIKDYHMGYGYIEVEFYEGVEKIKRLIDGVVLSLPSYVKE